MKNKVWLISAMDGGVSTALGIALMAMVTSCGNDDTHKHSFGTAWISNETHHWHECSCGEKSEVADHTWNWVETTAPTNTVDGEETRTCSICGETETRPILCQYSTQPFTIGTVDFVFEYRKDDTTSWAKLNTAIGNYINYIAEDPDATHADAITNLAGRKGAEFRIIVDYDTGKADGFTATDGQTLRVGSDYLINTNINLTILRNAFNAILAKPWPIE
jgi:hypothetical protein